MRKLFLLFIVLLGLVSCRTVRESESATSSSVRTVHDTIQQHVIVHRTDSVFVWKTDTGTNRLEKSQIVIYAADRESRHEAQRDTVKNIIYRTTPAARTGSRDDLQTIILLAVILYISVKHRNK
jgi:hypothetical protein